MSKPWRIWLHGLAAGVISAIGNAGSAYLGAVVFAPGIINEGFWKALAGTVVFNIFVTVFAYLKTSPIPGGDA